MAHVANIDTIVMRTLARDVAPTDALGPVWCGDHTEKALRALAAHRLVRQWSVLRDEQDHWHVYVTTPRGMTYHGRAVDHDGAMRAAIGSLIVSEFTEE